MTTGIDVSEGVIPHIAVAVEGLRITGRRDERIRLDEPSQARIVIPRVIEVQPGRIEALARELKRAGGSRLKARGNRKRTIRGVLGEFDELPGPIGDDVAAAEMIAVVEAKDARGSRLKARGHGGDPLTAGKDVLRLRPIRADFIA